MRQAIINEGEEEEEEAGRWHSRGIGLEGVSGHGTACSKLKSEGRERTMVEG